MLRCTLSLKFRMRIIGSSRARDFHPHPLTEPCVKVSPHTALHSQRFVHRHNLGAGLSANDRKDCVFCSLSLAAFEKQMNMPEWFGFVVDRGNCSAEALGDYNFLATEDKNNWGNDGIIPHGSKASKIGCKRITNRYNDLDINFSQDAICR